MKKPWRLDNNNGCDDEELQDLGVYFDFAVSPNKLDTLELVNRVGASWGMIGGNKYFKMKKPWRGDNNNGGDDK